jgi:hypothetical protein
MTERDDDDRGSTSENLTRKILTLGLGAYFLTEDTVRRYVKEMKIPRDVARGIVNNATKGKDELYALLARELSGFLKQMDVQAEVDRFVRSHKIKINAEIEFVPRPGTTGADASRASGAGLVDDASDPAGPPVAKGAPEPKDPKKPDVEWNVSVKRPPAPPPPPAPRDDIP